MSFSGVTGSPRPYYLGDPQHNNVVTHGPVNPYAFGPRNSPLRYQPRCLFPGCASVSFRVFAAITF